MPPRFKGTNDKAEQNTTTIDEKNISPGVNDYKDEPEIPPALNGIDIISEQQTRMKQKASELASVPVTFSLSSDENDGDDVQKEKSNRRKDDLVPHLSHEVLKSNPKNENDSDRREVRITSTSLPSVRRWRTIEGTAQNETKKEGKAWKSRDDTNGKEVLSTEDYNHHKRESAPNSSKRMPLSSVNLQNEQISRERSTLSDVTKRPARRASQRRVSSSSALLSHRGNGGKKLELSELKTEIGRQSDDVGNNVLIREKFNEFIMNKIFNLIKFCLNILPEKKSGNFRTK